MIQWDSRINIHAQEAGTGMKETTKQELSRIARRMRMLRALDYVKFLFDRIKNRRPNCEFARRNPGFIIPPAGLSYEALGHTSSEQYYRSGIAQAEFVMQIVRDYVAHPEPRICEWGCGPGRIVRHLPAKLAGRAEGICGADFNPRSIAWCRKNIDGVRFECNSLHPPLPFEDGFFDFVYALSVFTHLDEPGWTEWIEELSRVTRTDGVVFFTTHGKNSIHKLLPDEKDSFLGGRPVFRTSAAKGKKWYVAYHPSSYICDTLPSEFDLVVHEEKATVFSLPQEIWVVRKSGPQC